MQRTLIAAGFILAHVSPQGPRYLLLRNARHGDWGFAKGHAEPGENEVETALRETREETGIANVDVVPGFDVRTEYRVKGAKRGDYLKKVVYFLGRVESETIKRSDEHSEVAWLAFDEAGKRLRHPSLREALQLAHAKLTTRP